jgi:hypothetical protein
VRDASGARIAAEKPAERVAAGGAAKHTTTKHPAADNAPEVAANTATDTGANAPVSNSNVGAGTAARNAPSEPNAVASNVTPSNSAPPAASTASSSAGGTGTRSGLNSFKSHPASAGAAKPNGAASNVPLPESVQLSAGTRVWIVYRNITRRSDSSFAFTGSLLEPITGTGSTPVAKDTEIDGEGSAVNGKTSLTIERIVIRGVRYQIKGSSGGVVTQGSAGGGAALAFDAGQVQELWLAGPATYEKATDTGAGSSNP